MRKGRLVWRKQKLLIELFVAGSAARTDVSLVGVNKTTASQYFLRLGQLMYEHRDEVGFFEGEVEIESVISAEKEKANEVEAQQVRSL